QPKKEAAPAPLEIPQKPAPQPVVRDPAPEKPAPRPESSPKSTPDSLVFKPVAITAVNGGLWRRREGKSEAVKPATELARGDQIFTTSRRAANATTSAGCAVWLEPSSNLSVEQRSDGV